MGNETAQIRIATAAIGLLLSLALCLPAIGEARPDDGAILTPLAMRVLDPPVPVRGADGHKHLAYEIAISNQSGLDVTIDRVQAGSHGRPLGAAVAGAAFAEQLRVFGHESEGTTTVPPGGSAMLFMDVRYRGSDPTGLTHRWRLTTADPAGGPTQELRFPGVRTRVGQRRPLVVEAPLRGARWLDANGCCLPIGGHRGGTLAVDGTVHVGERYAIDFVGLDRQDRLFAGPKHELSSYGFYGAPVHSATGGKVVAAVDGRPEQTPGILPTDLTLPEYAGNYVTVRIDRHRYALYAHLERGSVRISRGDRVRPGEKLGLLGNSGNTDAPHLHFQIMNGRSPLQSNGLPFVFSRFTGTGVVTDLDGLAGGDPLPIADRLTGAMPNRMPLAQQLLTLPR